MNRRQILRSFVGAIGALTASRAAQAEPVQTTDGVAWLATGTAPSTGIVTDITFGPLPVIVAVPMPAMEPGRAYCSNCDARLMPSFGWQGLDHVAVRLWDHSEAGRTLSALQMPTRVWIDGERIEWAVEGIQGDPGWVLIDRLETSGDGRKHGEYCPTCITGDLRELRIGRVVFGQDWTPDHEQAKAIESYLLERSHP